MFMKSLIDTELAAEMVTS